MIIAGMVILTILAFLLINFFSGPSDNPGDNAGLNKQALIQEIEELESSIIELEVVFQEIQFEEDMSKELLEEKRDEIRNFDQKVKEQRKKIDDLQAKLDAAKRRGDVDKETIAKLQASIDKAEEQQTVLEDDFTKQEIQFLYMENRKLTAFSDSLIRMKPDSLETLVGDLRAQLRDCGNSPVITERGTEFDKEEFQKILASLKLTNGKGKTAWRLVNAKSDGSKIEDMPESSYKARKLKVLNVFYEISDGNIEKFFNGTKMHLVVRDDNNQEVTSSVWDKGSLINCDDADGKCITAGEAIFRSGNGIGFQLEGKGGSWEKNTYIFEIYTEGVRIGKKILLIN